MTEIAIQDETEDSLTAPGKLLRDRREEMGLTQAEVASKLHLSQQSIKDIEADDYSYFSAPIYVRGYLRNYAALLDLDCKPLLRAFEEMGFVDQLNKTPRASYIASSVSRTVRLHHSRKQLARWMSYVFFALIVTLVAVWWHGQRTHQHAGLTPSLITNTDTKTVPLTTSAPRTIPVQTTSAASNNKAAAIKHEGGDLHVSPLQFAPVKNNT